MSAKHTPGPWSLWGRADPSQVIASKDSFVAQTIGGNDEANARLIAAAPGLLEALTYARRMVKASECDIAFIDAAIAKATGE